MMSITKGLSSGYGPIGGVVVSGAVFEALSSEAARDGVFSHGFTYSSHPVSAVIAVEAMRIYRERFAGRATTLGRRLAARLQALSDNPMVGNIRACGFLGGVELMPEKARKIPFERVESWRKDRALVPRPRSHRA